MKSTLRILGTVMAMEGFGYSYSRGVGDWRCWLGLIIGFSGMLVYGENYWRKTQ